MIEFLRSSVVYWRDHALAGGSEHGAHDLKLVQETIEVGSSPVKVEDASNREAHMIEQMKAKDETIEFLRTSVVYWRNRATASGSEHGAHDLKLLQETIKVRASP